MDRKFRNDSSHFINNEERESHTRYQGMDFAVTGVPARPYRLEFREDKVMTEIREE